MRTETFDRILKWAEIINKKPNRECKFFYLSDNEKDMIIDLSKIKGMSPIKDRVLNKEKAYLFFDLRNETSIRFYSHDINPDTQIICNEFEGEAPVSSIELDILNFIEENIYQLTKLEKPFNTFIEMSEGKVEKVNAPVPLSTSLPTKSGYYNNYHGNQLPASSYSYDNSSYKEKSVFVDKLYELLKLGDTGLASDHINSFIGKKIVANEKSTINDIFRSLNLDKLDLISTSELIKSTESIKSDLYERAQFLTKFKVLVNKANSRRNYASLNDLQ